MYEHLMLIESTKRALLEDLCAYFIVVDSNHPTVIYLEEKSKLLKYLVDCGFVEGSLLENVVHERLICLGNESRDLILRNKALVGYSMKHGSLLIKSVKFDSDEFAGEYIVASDGLLESVIEQLLSYKNPKPQPGDNDLCCPCC